MPRVHVDPRELLDRSRVARRRALHVLSLMREEGESLTRAARIVGTDRRTVVKYAGTALKQDKKGGEYEAKAWDRIPRLMRFPTRQGVIDLLVKDSRSARRLSRYWNAVDEFLKTGNTRVLRPFRGKSVTVDKVARPFITDPDALRRLGLAGEVSFEDLYVDAA